MRGENSGASHGFAVAARFEEFLPSLNQAPKAVAFFQQMKKSFYNTEILKNTNCSD